MRLGEEGLKLIILYQKTLGISLDEAVIIIMRNKTAQLLLKEEMALSITGEKKNLSALMQITLLREPYDFQVIKSNEINLIHEYYQIDIGEKNCLSRTTFFQKSKQKWYNNKYKLVNQYICFLEKQNRIENMHKTKGNRNRVVLKAANLNNGVSMKKVRVYSKKI